MRFIHISDTHIGPTPAFSNYGHNSLANLRKAIAEINALPFEVDFVLHTGDVVEDRSEAAYQLAKAALDTLRFPIYYVAGNHDSAPIMQRVLLGREPEARKFDYTVQIGGITLAVLDSCGPNDPTGWLETDQLAWLAQVCVPDGPPLVLAIHHPPAPLDSTWLDSGWPRLFNRHMLLDNYPAFWEAIRPARERLRGVFFGHIHRAFQVWRDGVFLCSAPSTFGMLATWPEQPEPLAAPDEQAGYNLVTITDEGTIVRQITFARPEDDHG